MGYHHRIEVATAPTTPVLGAVELRERTLRQTSSDDDDRILEAELAAEAALAGKFGLVVAPQVLRFHLTGFPFGTAIPLPRRPIRTPLVIQYDDVDLGDGQTLGAIYRVLPQTDPPVVELLEGEVWPTCRAGLSPVRLEVPCGHATIEEVPPAVLQALRMLTRHYYFNPDAYSDEKYENIPDGVELLVAPWAVGDFATLEF